MWKSLRANGAKLGLVAAGLCACDSLRLEACYPLDGHEFGDDISAMESGIGWIVKFDKGDFFGRQALMKYRESRPRSLVGFFLDDPGIARHGDKLFASDGSEIGITTSGTRTPTINRALGLGLINTEFSKVGTEIFAEVRGKKLKCQVVKKPFYKRSK